jgi:LysR family nitrogen assimilation transcriptional regulator
MDIRELRYFVQVARAGSFSGAATRLNVAQPALSRQLKKLEDELGVQLLIRHGRGVEVTQAGAVLLSEAESLIDHVGQTMDRVRGGKPTFAGQVALGVAPTSGQLIVPDIFESFRAHWPDATLVIREGISSSLEAWLLERRVDIAVLHNPMPLEGIALRPILH